jgi:formylglycine-generating enzyme required for sulfatase activity
VSWEDAQKFIGKLNQIRDDGFIYRLPKEAEWEYAARAGTQTRFSFGDKEDELGQYGWFTGNSDNSHPVAQLKPNAFGLYDMHGNVWEWVQDWNSSNPAERTDPQGPSLGSNRVLRGGCWYDDAQSARSAGRYYNSPADRSESFGFRLVRTAK